MVGYLNDEAIRATEETGFVHFWSRSRDELWKKGETSGNTLRLVEMTPDCDGDALVIRAEPAGPTCHTGQWTCFGDQELAGFAALENLAQVIADRTATRPEGSYTVALLEGGVDTVSRKVVEEATEVLLAAKDHATGAGSSERLAEEAADLIYHLLALLQERSVAPALIVDEIVLRAGQKVRTNQRFG